ncbi:adhesin [Ralstonia pickettii]|uniref:Adhesin n=2 Tax=Ralstonia pickettii TaxID=329 RepID=A0A2N4TLL2_RALPI|nr:filamentous hemagglutinin N-terminal domain-containing protein [Ralstonia pickettii]PLC40593.1 adhesin [Ralstonia pickettii]
MNTRQRLHFHQLEQANLARDTACSDAMFSHADAQRHLAQRKSLWRRAVAGLVAVFMWLSPLTVTIEQSRSAAGVLNAGTHATSPEAWSDWVAMTALRIRLAWHAAQAAPIVDPNAPIVFRPGVTQTTGVGGGVPVVNITAPNAAGISLNQFQSFNIDPVGLILNNSLMGGTSLTGGQLSANPNLSNRVASTIINEVTATGANYASLLAGPLEVFGAPATVIIANPNGITTRGVGFVNTLGVTLSTGKPQFLSGPNGTTTDFTNAQAIGYNVTGGHIQIEGNAGVNGPGPGIEGTVGTIDLIGQTVGINAPLYAGSRINIIAGRQFVAPTSTTDSGTVYGTTSNGSSNTATAINAANGGANNGYAIDATAFGAVTAGQIQVVGTAAGMGVRMDAQLAANAGDLNIASNGDVSLAGTAAQQQANVQAAGNVSLTGTHVGVGGYTISAGGDVTSTGQVQSGKQLSATAGGNINVANTQSRGDTTLAAGASLQAGAVQSGGALAMSAAGNDGSGDITVTGATGASTAATLTAARDINLTGQLSAASVTAQAGRDVNTQTGANVQSSADTAFSAGRNLASQGTLNSGGNLTLTAGQGLSIVGQATAIASAALNAGGDTQISGSLASGAAMTIATGGNLSVPGSVLGSTNVSLNAGQAIDIGGVLIAQQNGSIHAGTNLTGAGSLAFGQGATLQTGNDVALTGKLLSNALTVQAGNGASFQDVQAGGAFNVAAMGVAGGGDVVFNGNVASVGAVSVTAQRDVVVAGNVAGGDQVTLSAARNVNVSASGGVQTVGALNLNATTGNVASAGQLTVGSTLAANAGTDVTLGGSTSAIGDVSVGAGRDIALSGSASTQGNAQLTAANNVTLAGNTAVAGNVAVNSGRDTNVSGSLQANAVNLVAAGSATLNNVQANGDLTVQAKGTAGVGDISVTGTVQGAGAGNLVAARDALVTGNLQLASKLNVNAGGNVTVGGTLQSNADVLLQANAGSITNTGAVQAGGNLTAGAAQAIILGTQSSTSALGDTVLTAGSNLTLGGTLVGQGNGSLSAGGAISGGGNTAFGLATALQSTGDTNLSGSLRGGTVQMTAGGTATLQDVQAGSTVNLSAGQDLNLTGATAAGANITASAGGNLNVSGSVQSAGNTSLTSINGSMTSTGTIASQGALGIQAGTDINLGGATTASGDATLSSGRDLVVSGTLNGQGSGTLLAGRDLTGAGVISFGRQATLVSGRDVNQGGLVQAQAVNVTAGNSLSVNNIESASTLDLQAQGNSGGGAIQVNGSAAAAGAVQLTAAQDVSIGGKLASGSNVTVNAQGNIGVAGAIEAVGNTSLTAQRGSLNASGGISSGGSLSIGTGLDLSLGASTSAVGSILLSAGRDAILNGVLVGNADGTVAAGRNITGAGTQAVVQALTLLSGLDLTLTGSMQANSVYVNAGNNAALNNVLSSTTLGVIANGNAGAGDVVLNGTVGAPGSIGLQAARDVAVNGALTGGADVQLLGARNVTVAGAVQSAADLLLYAQGGTASVTGSLATNQTLSVVAGLDVNLGGQASAASSFLALAGRDIALSGVVAGQLDGTLSANRNVTGAGGAAFAQSATVTAGQDTSLTGTLQGASVTVTAANTAGLGKVQAVNGPLNVTANGTGGGGDVTVAGAMTSAGDLTLQAARDVSVTGAVNSGGIGSVQAGRNASFADALNTVGALSVAANTGQVNLTTVATQGNLMASAGTSLSATGVVVSAGSANLSAGTDLTLSSGVAAQHSGALAAGGNLSAAAVAFGDQASLSAGGNISVTNGVATNGTLTATAGNSLTLGSAQAGTALTLTAKGQGGGGDIAVAGSTVAGGLLSMTASRDVTLNGAVLGYGTANATAGRNLSISGAFGTNADATLAATSGSLSVAGPLTIGGSLTATSGAGLSLSGGLVNGDTALTAQGGVTLTGNLLGLGAATIQAGSAIAGGGALSFAKDTSLQAGNGIALGSIETAGKFSANAGGDIALGATTAVGDVRVQSNGGSTTFGGQIATGGNLNVLAAQNVSATSGVSAVGAVSMTGTQGNVTVGGVSANGDTTLQAGQTLALSGTSTIAGQVGLSGNNVTLTGTLAGSKNVNIAAQSTLDSSQAQVVSTGNTTLSGTNVKTGNLLVGGALDAHASNQLSLTGQQVLAVGNATLAAGGTLANTSSVLAGGNLNVSGNVVTNASGASLASTGTTTVSAGSFSNAGIINGGTSNVVASGALTNSGSLLGLNALNISAGTLNNQGGLIFAGDPSAAGGPTTGDLSLTLTGGNGAFSNASGNILAQRNMGISAVSMAFDPTQGTISQGGQLNINAGSIYVSGTWKLGGQSVTANGINGFTNAGTITGTSAVTLGTSGLFTNVGQVSASDLTINGAFSNAAGALLHAGNSLTLNGSGTNRGTVESMGSLTVNGGSFDNQLATTQAAGNVTFNLSGTLQNTGGTITAGNNVSITAASVVNDQTAPTGQQTTTTVVSDPSVLLSNTIGTLTTTSPTTGEIAHVVSTNVATIGDLLAPLGAGASSATSVSFTAVEEGIAILQNNGSAIYEPVWEVTPSGGSQTLALPTVYRTVSTATPGTSGVISAGNSLSISANSLSNRGGQISAINGDALNVQSLSNGSVAPTLVNQSTTWVDPASLSTFLNALASLASQNNSSGGMFGLAAAGTGYITGDPTCNSGCTLQAPSFYSINTSSPAAQQGGTVSMGMPLGMIASGGNLTVSGGNLVNEGILYAGNNVVINAASLTNQGGNQQNYSSQVGCASGVPDTACGTAGNPRGNNPNTNTFSYSQQNASIYAGHDLVIAAGQVNNTYGNLIAGHNVVVGGVGSTASSTTPAQSLTNTSGNIVAGNNVELNVSGAITNTLPPPVPVHQNYGTQQQYAGCMTANGYKESYCEGYVDQQSGSSSVISAGNTLTINAGSLTNVGSLITAGANAVINVAGPVVNSAQTLNAYWHSHWVQETGMFSSDKRHDIWACGSADQCAQLYGSAYTGTGGVINPPTPVGNIAATIQAPNLSISSNGQIQNVGNVLGTSVSLAGQQLINGITTSNTYTPHVNAPSQVISLSPSTMPGLNLGVPRTVGSGQLPTPVPGKASYVDGELSPALSAGIGPQTLLSNLPANLQPSSTLFYYNPDEENLLLQQAALAQTGKASFVDGLTTDSQQNLSVTQIEKEVLYQNALNYAQANGLQLGTALTQTQVSQLDRPMLWYVEQTVPDPNCTATGTATCPTITALMPQVYLPANTSAMSAGGNISGQNVTLNFDQDGNGSILNTGSISASGTLAVNTNSLTNQANQVDVGQIWSSVSGGYINTTGTQVQPGGFMSAANMDLNVQTLQQIGGALQQLNADGTVDQAGTQQLLANLQHSLGGNFTQTAVADNLHQDFVKEGGSFGFVQLAAMVVAVAAAIMLQPEISGAIASMQTAAAEVGLNTLITTGSVQAAAEAGGVLASATFAAGGLANVAISVGLSSLAGSVASQVITTGNLNLGQALQAGAVAAITAGLTNGITGALELSNPGISSIGNNISQGNWAAVQSNLGQYAEASLARSLVSAGVNTIANGGSFGQALANGLVSDAAAVGANAIGANLPGIGTAGASPETVLANAIAHAALGCAAQSLSGGDCAGGAIGGAASAIVAPIIRDAVYADSPVLSYSADPTRQAVTVALSMLLSGTVGAAFGANVASAAQAAQNESLNNATSRYQDVNDPRFRANVKALGDCVDLVSCRSNGAFLQAQIGALSDSNIAAMCAGNTDCLSARLQERALYQQAYGQALAHLNPSIAARDYLTSQSQAQGNGYTANELANAFQRYQSGSSDPTNPVDAFVAKAIVGNVALFGAVRGITAVDSDGAGGSVKGTTSSGSAAGGGGAFDNAMSNHLAATLNSIKSGGDNLFSTEISTVAGKINVAAEVSANGTVLKLSDIAIYGANGDVTAGSIVKNIISGKADLIQAARDNGFTSIQITGVRVPNSSSANPGKVIDLTIPIPAK